MSQINMGVFMALDVGTVRIGAAVCDPLGLSVRPLNFIPAESREKDTDKVARIIEEMKPEAVVVGIPVNLDGSFGPMSRKAEKFIECLKTKTGTTIETVDERLTTAEAQRVLISADVSRRRRKDVVDGMAACIILQKFLAQRRKAHGIDEDT